MTYNTADYMFQMEIVHIKNQLNLGNITPEEAESALIHLSEKIEPTPVETINIDVDQWKNMLEDSRRVFPESHSPFIKINFFSKNDIPDTDEKKAEYQRACIEIRREMRSYGFHFSSGSMNFLNVLNLEAGRNELKGEEKTHPLPAAVKVSSRNSLFAHSSARRSIEVPDEKILN